MNIWGVLTTATALVLAFSGVTQAATLFSPPLLPSSSSTLSCELANLSTRDRTAEIQVLDLDGNVVGGSGGTITLAAGTTTAFATGAASNPVRCKFIVEGGKDDFRASVCVFQFSPPVGCTAAVEAR